jgi:hypothetical protein
MSQCLYNVCTAENVGTADQCLYTVRDGEGATPGTSVRFLACKVHSSFYLVWFTPVNFFLFCLYCKSGSTLNNS